MKTGIVLIVFGLVLSTGLGYYFGTITTSQQGETTTTTTSGSSSGPTSPYVLTLVITTANTFNSSVEEQSVYYVVGPNSLQSSANITLSAHRLIEVVIMNYDEGNATPISPQYDNVSGTVNGTMSVVSNNVVNSSEGPSGIVITGTQTVTSLPAALILQIAMASTLSCSAVVLKLAMKAWLWHEPRSYRSIKRSPIKRSAVSLSCAPSHAGFWTVPSFPAKT